MSKEAVALLRPNPNEEDCFDDLRFISLLNANFKILHEVLTTSLALVGDLVDEAQTCISPKKSIHCNLHLMRYITD